MANLIVVCRNDGIAGRLYRRTVVYLNNHDRPMHVNSENRHIFDRADSTDIRFITLREIDHGIDDGFIGIRMGDDVYEHWLDQVERMNRDKESKDHE